MARKVKCPICGKMNDKENTIVHNKRYYCKECYDKRHQREEGWNDLFNYICEIFDIDKPSPRIFQQIKNYKQNKDNPFTYIGMYLTLKYCKEILGMSFESQDGIGIIPYYYKEAEKFVLKLMDIEDKINEMGDYEVETITVRPTKKQSIKKPIVMLDVGDVDWEDDE